MVVNVLIDVAISGSRNVIKKETEKFLKYTDLTTDIQRCRMWEKKAICFWTWATGTISHHWDNTSATYVKSMKSRNCRKEPYWALHTHTAESADVEVQNIFNMGGNITCTINCNYRIAATLYVLETLTWSQDSHTPRWPPTQDKRFSIHSATTDKNLKNQIEY